MMQHLSRQPSGNGAAARTPSGDGTGAPKEDVIDAEFEVKK